MAKLYFRYGAIGCGKSCHLLQVANNYEEKGGSVLLIKPSIDTKGEDRITSRMGINRGCKLLEPDQSPWELLDYDDEHDCILVDEAQFLTKDQVDDLHNIATRNDCPVICYGLRTNYKIEDGGFEGATRLLQVAETIEELKTVCKCGNKATCNARFVNGIFTREGDDVVIDGENDNVEYKAYCYKCYSLLDAMYNEPHANGGHLPY